LALMPLLALCCLAAGLASPALATGKTMPQVTLLEANNGPAAGGNTVTIRGVAFSGSSPVRSVSFGGEPARRFTVSSDTTIEAIAPPGNGEAEISVVNARGEASPRVPTDRYAYDPAPSGPWLGLNGNSLKFLGPVDAFVERGALYDRSDGVEWLAGETLAQGGDGLAASIKAGMIPDVTIEFAGYPNCAFHSQCLPTSNAAIDAYVDGFIATATEIRAKYPAAEIPFEAINEPWGYGSASQYASILARLLPAAARADIPLTQIYAGAFEHGWVQDLYQAQPQLQSEIKGWYLHPYAGDRAPGDGIPSLPAIQVEMTSGQNNLIVSEMGFCAPDVNDAGGKCTGAPAETGDSSEAAALLEDELKAALPFHQAGWLRALIVYSRNDSGWAMQLKGGALTAQGAAFERFAEANSG
jgi:IPT/TIG domain